MAANDHDMVESHVISIDELNLHEECSEKCRSSVILRYIEQYPESLAKVDDSGCLPLHRLLENMSSSIDVALLMMEKYPAASEHQDIDDNLPIHIECKYQCRSIIIAKCIELHPECLQMAEDGGCLPLYLACDNKLSSIDDVLMMIEKYPAALQRETIYGILPFHIECMNQCRSIIIAKCIELYPACLDDRAINMLMTIIDKSNFSSYSSVLSIMFITRPMSLYDRDTYSSNDTREEPTCRRRILSLLPRHVFTPTHESDYRDLNWQPRAAIMLLMSQMTIRQQQSRQQQGSSSNRNMNAAAAALAKQQRCSLL
jgi:hypothetical protein